MEMTFRWYGSRFDTVTLKQIKQIRYVTGIITTLYDKQPGDLWTRDEIHALKKEVEDAGLHIKIPFRREDTGAVLRHRI